MSKAQKEKENCESVIHVLMWWSNQDYFVGVFIPYSIREDTSSPMTHDPAMPWAQPPVVDTCRPTMAWKRHPIPTLPLLWLSRLGAYYKPWHSSLYSLPSSLHVRNSHGQESSPTCLFIIGYEKAHYHLQSMPMSWFDYYIQNWTLVAMLCHHL